MSTIKTTVILMVLYSTLSISVHAEDLPLALCDIQGIFQVMGQSQTCSMGFKFHDGLDIVVNASLTTEEVPVRCVRDGWLAWLKQPDFNTSEIWILIDTGVPGFPCSENTFDVYAHVVPTEGKGSITKKWERTKTKEGDPKGSMIGPLSTLIAVEEGEIIGYVSRADDPENPGNPEAGYGSNAAVHLHFARFEGDYIDSCYWACPNLKIKSNPQMIFESALPSDESDPIFQNIYEDPTLDEQPGTWPIDVVDDAAAFGETPHIYFQDYADSRGNPEYHYDNVDKTHWPWRIQGKVDIWASAVDNMNAKGTFTKYPVTRTARIWDPFDIYSAVNRIEYDVKDIGGQSIFGGFRLLVDFNDFVLDKERFDLQLPYLSAFAPWRDSFQGYTGYREHPHPSTYIATNTDGEGNPQASGCWDTSLVENGSYTIEVTVSDLDGNSATATLPVEVSNSDIYVDDDSPSGDGSIDNPFPSITQALAQATSGQRVYIFPGEYDDQRESFPLLVPESITLRGAGIGRTIITGAGEQDIPLIKCENLTAGNTIIEGLSVTGGGTSSNPAGEWHDESVGYGSALYVKSAPALTIQNCDIHENQGFGIFVFNTSGPSSPLLIQNNIIRQNGYDNVRFQRNSNGRLYNNTILAAGSDGVRCFGQGNPLIDSDIVYANMDYGIMAVPGGGSIPGSVPQINYCSISGNGAGAFGGTADCTAGCIYSDPLLVEGSYSTPFLMQAPLQTPTSPCVNAAHIGWNAYGTTRTDYAADSGRLDMGFHYPERLASPTPPSIPTIAPVSTCTITPTPGPDQGILDSMMDWINDILTITLGDPNAPGPGDPEVHVSSESDPVGFTMPLAPEATPGHYSGPLGFVPAPTPSDPVNRLLSVSNPDWLTIVYEDESPEVTVVHERGYAYGTPTPTPTPSPTTGPWEAYDEYGNHGSAPETFSWIDATGGTDLNISEDDGWAEVTLPFSFTFYGQDHETLRVSANGYLTFGEHSWSACNTFIPKPEQPNGAIDPYWTDLNPSVHGAIYTMTSGTEPNRVFVVEWYEVPHRYRSDQLVFEVLLYEGSDEIRFQYLSMPGEGGNGLVATVGIENSSGGDGIRYSGRFIPGTTYNELAILFAPPSPAPTPTPSPTPFDGYYTEDFENGALGWTADGLWHIVDDTTSNCPPTPGSHSPSHSWYYGREDTCAYDTGDENSGDLISPPIQLAGLATLSFYSWSEIEPGGGVLRDSCSIWVSIEGEEYWDYVGYVPDHTGAWGESVELTLGEQLGPGRIKFRFETGDQWRNDFRGWYVDDVELIVLTPTPTPLPLPSTSPGGLAILLVIMGALLSVGFAVARRNGAM